eukprot:TRINITY_DN2197_c0_g1_i1.p1 TRINITY_DN2197_c0_g1~~TRINITY_DN2197_c0_g1_i1.p1  ORF type:complete len:199 (-),score=23.86 TRINITY_DN2197_c0_g1_i1:211-807(-)
MAPARSEHIAHACPLCGTIVIAHKGQDINTQVSRHIDAGCNKEATPPTTVKRVTCAKCGTKELHALICRSCGRNHCVKHRAPATHDCPKIKAAEEARRANLEKLEPRRSAADAIRQRLSTLMSSAKGDTAKRVRAMKARNKALGQSAVPEPSDRVVVELILPMDLNRSPVFCVSVKEMANWKVSRCLCQIGQSCESKQ